MVLSGKTLHRPLPDLLLSLPMLPKDTPSHVSYPDPFILRSTDCVFG